ncbi:transposase family protein [Streptomyces minutiscleroticus]|uniref:transposase family protein n=1 Tax=Streptomyces minutiscleroticus TaxID=68238 RepID=UPI0033328686
MIKPPTHAQRPVPRVVDRPASLIDPRDRRWQRHSLVSMLLTACCAVPADAPSYAAVDQWAAQVPQNALARPGVRTTGPFALHQAPATSTIQRVMHLTCSGGPADLLGRSPADARQVAVDGRTARGSPTSSRPSLRRTHGRPPADADKTTEVTGFTALLAPFDPGSLHEGASSLPS